jgi:deoxyadenosine/deoxycytidine kinase
LLFRHIAIEGPPGVGKTVLAERLGARLDATVVLDERDNPFLADFYQGRSGAAFQTQLFYTLARYRHQGTLQPAARLELSFRSRQDLRVREPR